MILFILCSLAIWRITSMLNAEDGPQDIFITMRSKARRYTGVFDCFLCLSVWIALPFSLLFPYWFISWLALSAGAIIIEAVINKLND